MPAAVSSITALLTSVLMLIAGNGLINTLVPMRAKLEGFPDLALGLLGSAYFAGMLAGTLAAPGIIARAGYIRAFAAFVAGSVVLTLVYPYAVHPAAWVGLRYGIGFLFSGFYAVIEAWLSDKSNNANRGRIYASYQVVSYGATAAGQEILAFIDPHSAVLFSITAGALRPGHAAHGLHPGRAAAQAPHRQPAPRLAAQDGAGRNRLLFRHRLRQRLVLGHGADLRPRARLQSWPCGGLHHGGDRRHGPRPLPRRTAIGSSRPAGSF